MKPRITRTRQFYGIALLCLLSQFGCEEKSDAYQGYIEGEYRCISTQSSGYLSALHVTRGQDVEKDAPLYSLSNDALHLQVNQAEANLAAARGELSDAQTGLRIPEIAELQAGVDAIKVDVERLKLERMRQEQLAVSGSTAQRFLDEARLREERAIKDLEQARLGVENAKLGGREGRILALEAQVTARQTLLGIATWNADQMSVSAPVSGRIEALIYKTGEWIPAASPVIKMLSPEDILVYFFIPETDLTAIKTGMRVELRFDGLDAPRYASIIKVSSSPEYTPPVIYSRENNARLVYRIEGRLDPADATLSHPGQPVQVRTVSEPQKNVAQ